MGLVKVHSDQSLEVLGSQLVLFNIISFNAIAVTFTFFCRVSKITEDILFEQQENCDSADDTDEGAKLCKMLERAAEPEVIMAGMTSEQLMQFSSYKEKQKVSRCDFC
jgi:hypothetical protein